MSESSAYDFETARGYSIIAFNKGLGDARWGDIEQVGNELKERIAALDRPVFMLDLSRMEFMGSSIVALIVRLWKTVQENQGGMVVVNSSNMTKEVLEIAGLNRIWTIVATREEAASLLSQPPFQKASGLSAFFLAILGWVAAAGAVGLLLMRQRQIEIMDGLDGERTQILAYCCAGVAAIVGLVAAFRDTRIWRVLGILLILVAGSLVALAAFT